MQELQLGFLSTFAPTYWPTDPGRTPDLLDFFVTKGIASGYLTIESNLDLSSDHSPVIATISSTFAATKKPATLFNKRTDWEYFRHLVDRKINLKIPLKNNMDIEVAVNTLNCIIQESAWEATPEIPQKRRNQSCPVAVREKITIKRQLRRIWHNSRYPSDKRRYDKASRDLKTLN